MSSESSASAARRRKKGHLIVMERVYKSSKRDTHQVSRAVAGVASSDIDEYNLESTKEGIVLVVTVVPVYNLLCAAGKGAKAPTLEAIKIVATTRSGEISEARIVKQACSRFQGYRRFT
jgi:hypothetical protein